MKKTEQWKNEKIWNETWRKKSNLRFNVFKRKNICFTFRDKMKKSENGKTKSKKQIGKMQKSGKNGKVRYRMEWNGMEWYGMVQYGIVWYGMV